MQHFRFLAVTGLMGSLGACATYDDSQALAAYAPGPQELVGRALLIEDGAGEEELVTLLADGTVRLREAPGAPARTGSWGFRAGVEPDRPEDDLAGLPASPASSGDLAAYEWLCVDFPPPGERCWRYQAPLVEDEPVEIVSAAGEELTVTLVAK